MIRNESCSNLKCNNILKKVYDNYTRVSRDMIRVDVQCRILTIKANIKEHRHSKEISELKKANHNLEKENDSLSEKLDMKDEEIMELKEKLATLEATKALEKTETQFLETRVRAYAKLATLEAKKTLGKTEAQFLETRAKAYAKLYFESHEEKIDLQEKLEQEKAQTDTLQRELEEERGKAAKLEEVIDKQKFDLDEARSGLKVYSDTPILEKTLENEQEELGAKYEKETQQLKDQCEKLKDKNKQLKITQEKHVELGANYSKKILRRKDDCVKLQEEHPDNVNQIVSKVNAELIVVDITESKVSRTLRDIHRSWFFIVTNIVWVLLLNFIISLLVSPTQPRNCPNVYSQDFLDFAADFF